MKTQVIRLGRMTGALLLALFLLIFIVLQAYGATPGQRLWVRRYNGPGNGGDAATAMAVDRWGNVYVTGWSSGAGTSEDYATIKYSPAGRRKWARRYNGPGNGYDEAHAIAVDRRGNVYVTGYSTGSGTSWDYATIKYGPDGKRKWVRRYNGPANWTDQATAIAVDASGNVYVTGHSEGRRTDFDYLTIKYSPAGRKKWVRRYNGPGNFEDKARAIALDGSGNVYVAGWSYGSGTSRDYATIKYSPTGKKLWVRRYDYGQHDVASAIAVDTSGNVYVTGSSTGSGTDADYATIKYSRAGRRKWVRRYNGPGNSFDYAIAIALDSSGNVCVTGWSGPSYTDFDYATIKYGPAGRRKWVKRYNGPGNGYDGAHAIAADTSGNVYVTGRSYGSGADEDYATIKYSRAGRRKWVRRYNGPGNSFDSARTIALDAGGNVYVTGHSAGSTTGDDYATIKYAP